MILYRGNIKNELHDAGTYTNGRVPYIYKHNMFTVTFKNPCH